MIWMRYDPVLWNSLEVSANSSYISKLFSIQVLILWLMQLYANQLNEISIFKIYFIFNI